eukprot:TRINITY_DN55231_c0_g1_i1.p1 TRINITY_DN55231_c0_g1~~TRINITY_DN55231_c0_g1_i1.p1  ORF type:complete len:399 (-),score=21.27 TRINITY_DN55231_c0_g1_i1:1322-2518(-)
MSFYEVLQLPKTSYDADIKLAFRAHALRWHPGKNVSDPTAEQRFSDICGAYEVLSHWRMRSQYDRYGVKGLDELRYRPAAPNTVFTKFFEEHGGLDVAQAYVSQRCSKTDEPPLGWDEMMAKLEARHGFEQLDTSPEAVIDPWGQGLKPKPKKPEPIPEFTNSKDRMMHNWKSKRGDSSSSMNQSVNLHQLSDSFRAELSSAGQMSESGYSTKAAFMNDWKRKQQPGSISGTPLGSAPPTAASIKSTSRTVGSDEFTSAMDSIDTELFDISRNRNIHSRLSNSSYGHSSTSGGLGLGAPTSHRSTDSVLSGLGVGGSIKDQMMSSWRSTTDTGSLPYSSATYDPHGDTARLRMAHESFKNSLTNNNSQPATPPMSSAYTSLQGHSAMRNHQLDSQLLD